MTAVLIPIILLFSSMARPLLGQEGTRDDTHLENVVRQAVADEFSSEILTNRTRAYLSCASGEMVVKLNFSEPFRGVTYTDYDRTSPCRFNGDGSKYYELRIPLRGCGTRQEAARVFINNIIVRFHRSLELEEDEIKTIICRYPPPLAPPPSNVAPVLLPTAAVPAIIPPKLSEVELLLIICALLFLTLLLLGIGVAYYCLKKRNIKVIKKRKAISSGPGSEITKLSGSTMGTLSMFDPIRIPRAMAQSTSGSEAALLPSLSSQNGSGDHSDTIPSDYPSESPSSVNSDVEEIEGSRRMMINDLSTMRGDHFRYQNTAFIPDEPMLIPYPADQERASSISSIPAQQILKPVEVPKKKLKTRIAKEQILTTISEREDILHQRESMQRTYAAMRQVPSELNLPPCIGYIRTHQREVPEPPSYAPSLYGSIPDNDNRSEAELLEAPPTAMKQIPSYAPSLQGSIPDNDIWSHSELESEVAVMPYKRRPKRETATISDYYITKQDVTDIKDTVSHFKQTTIPKSPSPTSPKEDTEATITNALVPRKPKITVQKIDDVFLTTTTEIEATETVTKTTKDTVAQHVKSQPALPPSSSNGPPTQWDVTIKHYPNQPFPDYDTVDRDLIDRRVENYVDISEQYRESASTSDTYTHKRQIHPFDSSRGPTPSSPQKASDTPTQDTRPLTYATVIFKIIEPPQVEGVECLTPDIKEKWRTVITTDETFRHLITEATTVEEYIRITKDTRYEKLFDTRTWHVIIRCLSTPDDRDLVTQEITVPDARNPRYKKRSDFEPPRNRRSSLPPVCEFSLGRPDAPPSSCGSIRSRRTSRSGSVPEYDLRSMTEVDVDFAHADRESLWSVDTGYTYKTTRSLAERSTSEFLEEVPTMVADQQQTQQYRRNATSYYVEQSAFASSQDSFSKGTAPEGYPIQRRLPRFLERSSTEYFEDIPTMSLPDLRTQVAYSAPSSRPMDNVIREIRQNGMSARSRAIVERSNAEIIIDSPIVRAIDLASSIGEREEIKSVTETDIFDWKR